MCHRRARQQNYCNPCPTYYYNAAPPTCAVYPPSIVEPQIPSTKRDSNYTSKVLSGRSFYSVIPEIKANLPIARELNPSQINLKETSKRESIDSELKNVPLFSSLSCKEFHKVVSFSVPSGQRVIGLDSFRYGAENNGALFTGRINNSFQYPRELRERMHDLYEVHVEQKNGQDHYTICITDSFVGGLRVSFDRGSVLILTHAENPNKTPEKIPQDAPPVPSDLPSKNSEKQPAPKAEEQHAKLPKTLNNSPRPNPPTTMQVPPGINIPGDLNIEKFGKKYTPGEDPKKPPQESKHSEREKPEPQKISDNHKLPKLPPLKGSDKIVDGVEPKKLPAERKASEKGKPEPQDLSANEKMPKLPPPRGSDRTVDGVEPKKLPAERKTSEKGKPEPQGLGVDEKMPKLPLPRGSDKIVDGVTPKKPPAERKTSEKAKPEPQDLGEKEKMPSLPPVNKPGRTAEGESPLRAKIKTKYTPPVFTASEPKRDVSIQLDYDIEQKKAILGYFAMKSLILRRKDLILPLESAEENDKKNVDQYTFEVYGHAYYPPENAFLQVKELARKDKTQDWYGGKESSLTETLISISKALNGEEGSTSNLFGSQERAKKTESFLKEFGPTIGKRKASDDRDTSGERDIQDIEAFARHMRGVVPYLESNLEYMKQRLKKEGFAADVIEKLPKVRAENGYHSSVESMRTSLEVLFSSNYSPVAFEASLEKMKDLKTWRLWEFADQDIQEMEKLLTKAKEAHNQNGCSSRFNFVGSQLPYVADLLPTFQKIQQGRVGQSLEAAEKQIEILKKSRALLPLANKTDSICIDFLRLLPNNEFDQSAVLFSGEGLDKKSERIVASLDAMDEERKKLAEIGGRYAETRVEMLDQRRADFLLWIKSDEAKLLETYPAIEKRLTGAEKITFSTK